MNATKRIAVVTGANSGLGFETTKVLVKQGIKVIMACRNSEKAEIAKATILKETPDAILDIIPIDLSDFSSVRTFVHQFLHKYDRLDILVNNAGLMGNKFELSKDGFEYQYAANFLGHFLLTGLLLPLLNQTESARIVSLASIAHRFGKININKINQSKHYYPFGVYSNTKLACLLFSNYLSKKLADKNVKTIAVAAHPGISITNISHKLPEKILKAQHFVGKLFMSNQVEGAESIVMASLDLSVKNGDYIGPSGWFEIKGKPKKVKCTSAAKNWDKAEELWAFAEKATNISY